jgi:hypothetical protein
VAEEVHLDPANAAARTAGRLEFNIAAKTEFVETIASRSTTGATRRLHLRFLAAPTKILGSEGRVTGIRFTRMAFMEQADSVEAVVANASRDGPPGVHVSNSPSVRICSPQRRRVPTTMAPTSKS